MKSKYLAAIIVAMTVSPLLLMSLAYAPAPSTVNIYAWTDKTYYDPGGSGTLTIVIRNDRTDTNLILENITITYPWFAYLGNKWDGNDTITPSPPFNLSKNGAKVYNTTVTFTVPNDGRASSLGIGLVDSVVRSSEISIQVAVDKSPFVYTDYVPLDLRSSPSYTSVQDMGTTNTLLAVLVVLLVVCTLIITATMFLTSRKPKVT